LKDLLALVVSSALRFLVSLIKNRLRLKFNR
jgi:hypothetical protein